MNFISTFCHPFEKEIRNLGEIDPQKVIPVFQAIPWKELVTQMETAPPKNVIWSPSLEIANQHTKHGIVISAVGPPGEMEFYIFYRRPKIVKQSSGKGEVLDNEYTTDITGQTEKDCIECLEAFTRGDTDFLEKKVK